MELQVTVATEAKRKAETEAKIAREAASATAAKVDAMSTSLAQVAKKRSMAELENIKAAKKKKVLVEKIAKHYKEE